MPTILQPEELKQRFAGHKKSLAWYDSSLIYQSLRVHLEGELPINLIKNARPNESDEVRKYRQKIYESETQNPVERVIGLLEKIRRSPDWMIRFDGDVPAIINEEETLKKYISENYPVNKSFENWLFEEALKNIAIDGNAVCIVMPFDLNVNPNEYVKPVSQIFNAPKVVDFVAGDYVIVMSDEYSSLLSSEMQQSRAGAMRNSLNFDKYNEQGIENSFLSFINGASSQVYYVVTTLAYQKWEETTGGMYQLTAQFIHGLNALPAFQLPGKFYKRMGASIVKKTPLHPMVPHLNKAARESSDLDAGVIMHLYLEKWRINNVPCAECKGTTQVPGVSGPVPCKKCDGTGLANGKSPFNEIIIKPASIGEQNIPTPPLGYVAKDPKILEIQNDRIKEHIYKALSSVGVEHLGEAPLDQSGVAKAYDRDEVNNLIYLFAEMLVYVADNSIYWFNQIRYKNVVTDPKVLNSMLPMIPVPEKYDVVNTTFLLSEYQLAKTAGLNTIILDELQKEISEKKFYSNPDVAKKVRTIMECDPFPSKTLEEKSLLESQNLASKEDVILSNYISDFVNQAMETDKAFLEKTTTQKRAILLKLAKAKTDELNTAKQIAADMFTQTSAQQQQQNTMKTFNADTRLLTGVQNAKL